VDLLGGKSEHVFIGGYNRGVNIAIASYLQYQSNLGGVYGVNGMFCASIDWSKIDIENKKRAPIHLVHGEQDGIIPCDYAEKTVDYLKSKGLHHVEFEKIAG
jgi:predicted esterase